MKLLIVTIGKTKPSFIDYQYACLKKYITQPFEFILFDESDSLSYEFKRHSNYIEVPYIKIPKNTSSVNYILNYVYNDLNFRGILMIIEPNLFLVNEYNPIEKISNNTTFFYKNINPVLIINFSLLSQSKNLEDFNKLISGSNIKYNISNKSEVIDNSFIYFNNIYSDKNKINFESEDKLFTFLCCKLIDWNIKKDTQNKYIISFSLYGDNPKYTHNAIMNALLAKKIYSGWICRYYVDHTVPQNIISILKSFDNTEVIIIDTNNDKSTLEKKRIWRFYPASDNDVAVMISRDSDSWLSFREAFLVKKWVESDKQFHIIRDHCYHDQKIMAGMWGTKRDKIKDMYNLCIEYMKNNSHDQSFLAEQIYPKIIDSVLVHIGENQKNNRAEISNGYFDDGGVSFEKYPKILEYIPTIDIEQTNELNKFVCRHCLNMHNFCVGVVFENLHYSVREYLSKILY